MKGTYLLTEVGKKLKFDRQSDIDNVIIPLYEMQNFLN